MTPGQAQAQTETEPVWSTTMTVGEATVSEALGYSIDSEEGFAGSVVTNTFSYGDPPVAVVVESLVVSQIKLFSNPRVGASPHLLPSDWVLVVAGESLPLSAADNLVSGYYWTPSWLATNAPSLDSSTYETTLVVGETVAVCLRTPDQVCPGEIDATYDPAEDPTNADLSTLSVTNGAGTLFALSPEFDSDTVFYEALVPANTNSWHLTATTVNPNATIRVNEIIGIVGDTICFDRVGTMECSNNWSPGIDELQLHLSVVPEDSGVPDVYAITLRRLERFKGRFEELPSSHDGVTAFVVGLRFFDDITSPLPNIERAIEVTNGTASNVRSVGGSTRRFDVDITPSSAAPVQIRVLGAQHCGGSHAICGEGSVFTGGFNRWVSTADDARLRVLWLTSKDGSWIKMKPVFKPDTTSYTVQIEPHLSEVTLQAAPYTSGATIAVTGPADTFTVTNRWDGGKTVKVDGPDGSTSWSSTLTVTVTSDDGNETRSYKVAMNREPADVRLKTLTVTPVDGTLLSFSPSFHLDTEAQTFRVRVSSDTDAVTVSVEKNSGDPRVRLMRTETLRLDSIDEDPDLAGIQFELTMDRFDLGGARENRYRSIWVIGPNSTRFFNRRVYQLWITKGAVGHATAADPLMAAFENAPLSHDGSSAFTFRMAFTEDVEITPEDMRDHAFVVSGGTVTGAERVGGLKSLWELTLEPTGSGPVSILTPLERACTEAGALCTADGRSLSVAPALQVAGPVPAAPALTATLEDFPSNHDGSTAFTFRIAFSADVEITPEDMRDHALTVTGATVTAAARVDDRKDLWELTLAPSGSGTVSILTPLERACTEAGALCTADGRSLTGGLGVQVPGPAPATALTASFESVPQAHDGTSAFTRQIRSDCRCGVVCVKHAPTGFHCCPFARPATDFTVIGRSDGDGCGRAGGVLRPAGVSGGPSCAEGEWRGDGGSPQGRSGGRGPRAGVGGHLEEVEHTARISGQATHGLGDGEPARLDEADGEAAQPGHVLRAVAGADAAAVLVEGPVEDVVGGLDGPVPAIEGEQALRGCALWGQAGDAVDGLAVSLGGVDLDGLAPYGEDLSDAGEVEVVVECAGDPDGAALAAPVLGFGALVGEVRCTLGDVLVEGEPDIVEHVRLVALDGEQIVGAAPEEIGGQRALGEQGIGGDGVPCDVGHRLEQGEDGADLVGALLRFVGVGPHADFFCSKGVLESWPTMPSTCAWRPSSSRAPRSALPSMAKAVSPEPWAWCQARRAASSWAGSTRMSRLRIAERLGARCWPLRRRTRKRSSTLGLRSSTHSLMAL